jgi:protein-L-isoaspartate O-methyltransferase
MTSATSTRIESLAGYLVSAGVLAPASPDSQEWLAGLRAVPRHQFVPPRAWAEPMDDRPEHLIDHDADAEGWYEAIYTNTAVITQRGDGTADVGDVAAPPTSSLSCPHVSLEMLRMLSLANGDRVLEIGAGTGWTAAMLAWRLPDGRVTTMEVDEQVAAQARRNLASVGSAATVVTGDGALGHPPQAPYDMVHVTCGIRDVPFTWIEQTGPGGIIVAPFMPAHGQCGELLRLTVRPGATANGRFRGSGTFMMMRTQRTPRQWPSYQGEGITSATKLDPRTIAWDGGFGLYLAGSAPHLVVTSAMWETFGAEHVWVMRLRGMDTGWALACVYPDRSEVEIIQGGGRRLWEELEDRYERWARLGCPAAHQFGLTVNPAGQHMWLGSPDTPVS